MTRCYSLRGDYVVTRLNEIRYYVVVYCTFTTLRSSWYNVEQRELLATFYIVRVVSGIHRLSFCSSAVPQIDSTYIRATSVGWIA